MLNIPSEVVAFFNELEMCKEGFDLIERLGVYGLNFDEVAKVLKQNGYREEALWMLQQKKTEAYIRFYGKELKLGAFQVHNPLTGTHTRYETEEEARAACVDIANQILNLHKPAVVRELSNENGDTTWIPVDLSSPIQAS